MGSTSRLIPRLLRDDKLASCPVGAICSPVFIGARISEELMEVLSSESQGNGAAVLFTLYNIIKTAGFDRLFVFNLATLYKY